MIAHNSPLPTEALKHFQLTAEARATALEIANETAAIGEKAAPIFEKVLRAADATHGRDLRKLLDMPRPRIDVDEFEYLSRRR